MQKIKDLRLNQESIRTALAIANANTSITINDKQYTIVEAIRKKNDVQIDRQITSKLAQSLQTSTKQADQNNQQVESNIQSLTEIKAGTANPSQDFIKQARESMIALNGATICNEKIAIEDLRAITDSIENFENQIDYALSEINALTKIDVTLA